MISLDKNDQEITNLSRVSLHSNIRKNWVNESQKKFTTHLARHSKTLFENVFFWNLFVLTSSLQLSLRVATYLQVSTPSVYVRYRLSGNYKTEARFKCNVPTWGSCKLLGRVAVPRYAAGSTRRPGIRGFHAVLGENVFPMQRQGDRRGERLGDKCG